jgi:hypothetical protein
MGQSKKDSIKEVVTSTTIGMVGSWSITMICLMFFTTPIGIATSTTIACTVFSLTRGYFIRRYFNDKWGKHGGIEVNT